VLASGFHAEGVDWRDIGASFYNSLGYDARGAARRAQPRPALRLTTGRVGALTRSAFEFACFEERPKENPARRRA